MKTIVLFIDHGLTLAYYLYTGLAKKLIENDVRLVFLVQDDLIPRLQAEFQGEERLVFESMREDQLIQYARTVQPGLQEIIEYIRGASASPRIPLTYVDTHRQRKEFEAKGRWKAILIASRPAIGLLRYSRIARKAFLRLQQALFTTNIYGDLLDKYQPDLVISATAGWRLDRYLLRETARRGIKSAVTIVGWDNPSAHGIPGAPVDYAVVWSEIHRWELSAGIDWPTEKIFTGGMPLYDGYLNHQWLIPRDEYFAQHDLDPNKKLIAYAATALSISPNLHIIEALTDIISQKKLSVPAQLLIRLHPNHFKPDPRYKEEREAIYQVTARCPDVHVVAPKALAGGLPRYSGEDFPEKTSMLAHCDVLLSIYSTMVVEAALHDKPVVSVCIDSPTGWEDKFWIPLHDVPYWPTAARVNKTGANRNAFTTQELVKVVNDYLVDPTLDAAQRRQFVEQEVTYLHGESTPKTAEYLLSLLTK